MTRAGGQRQAFERLPDATVVVDPTGIIRSVNALAARLVHSQRSALEGRPAAEALPLSDEAGVDWWAHARPLEVDPRLLPRIAERDLLLRTASGMSRRVALTGNRVRDADGRLAQLVLSLRRAERRARMDDARSELISTVSHELRSPLTSVKGFTRTLLAKWDRFDDATKRQMLVTVNEDADRVTRLLGELLDVSRIDAGRLPLRRQMIAVPAVVAPLIQRLRLEHPEQPIAVGYPADLPELYADPDRIAQVFANLLENAVKYGAGTVRVGASVEPDEVRFSVEDEGGTIPQLHLRHIFTKFYQRQGQRQSGSGLGLYICHGIVAAHGGRIWAASSPEQGTRFTFSLPRGGLELAGVTRPAES